MLVFAILALIIAILLFWQSGRQRKSLGLPAGRVIYTDTRGWGPVEQPLYDAELGLTGKPDYLVESGSELIPVEVKSSRVSSAPYDSHIFQLAVYCLLVQRHYGKRPAYGILHYPNRTFAIDYTPELEKALLELLQEMRKTIGAQRADSAGPPRSHDSAARCARCGYRNFCDQNL
jgi:CRISPR-associated exonuclease Cas4